MPSQCDAPGLSRHAAPHELDGATALFVVSAFYRTIRASCVLVQYCHCGGTQARLWSSPAWSLCCPTRPAQSVQSGERGACFFDFNFRKLFKCDEIDSGPGTDSTISHPSLKLCRPRICRPVPVQPDRLLVHLTAHDKLLPHVFRTHRAHGQLQHSPIACGCFLRCSTNPRFFGPSIDPCKNHRPPLPPRAAPFAIRDRGLWHAAFVRIPHHAFVDVLSIAL